MPRAENHLDGNYENRVQIGPREVTKSFRRPDRYRAELETLRCIEHLDIGPRVTAEVPSALTIVMTRLPGRNPELTSTDGSADHARLTLAGTLRRLHSVHPSGEDAAVPLDQAWLNHVQHRLKSLTLPASGQPDLERWLRSAARQIPDMRPVRLHHDLKPANMLCSASGLRLVDFDQSRWGHPLSDLGKLLWRGFGAETGTGGQLWQTFLTAYLGRAATEREHAAVAAFRVSHAIGALAYWADFGYPAYQHHARAAARIVAAATGVPVGLATMAPGPTR